LHFSLWIIAFQKRKRVAFTTLRTWNGRNDGLFNGRTVSRTRTWCGWKRGEVGYSSNLQLHNCDNCGIKIN